MNRCQGARLLQQQEKPGTSRACNGEAQDEGQELAHNSDHIVVCRSDSGEIPAYSAIFLLLSVFCQHHPASPFVTGN